MKKHLYIPIFLLAHFSCSDKNTEDSLEEDKNVITSFKLTDEQIKWNGIEWQKPEMEIISEEVRTTGVIDVPPQNMATVSTVMAGFVKDLDLYVGSYVKKGETLAVLYHPDFISLQQDYLKAVAKMNNLDMELNRQKELSDQNVSARKSLERAHADFSMAQAEANAIKSRLKMINLSPERILNGEISTDVAVKAPIAGHIKSIGINIGMFVSPAGKMFEIIDRSHMHAELSVFENDVLKIKPGQKVSFSVSGTRKVFRAHVHIVGKALNSESKSISIHCHIDAEDEKELIPGMFVNAAINVDSRTEWVIPESALLQREGSFFVFLKSPGLPGTRFTLQQVVKSQNYVTGASTQPIVMEENGIINENSEIVTKGVLVLYGEIVKSDED